MEYRVTKLREYLYGVLNNLTQDIKDINVDMLKNGIDNYSLDKIPTESVVSKWISGIEIHRDVYSFRSRRFYSTDYLDNLQNIGFFEKFEAKIKSNNKEGVLPEINGIETIECLNTGTMTMNEDGKSAIFSIQIQITYREENKPYEENISV